MKYETEFFNEFTRTNRLFVYHVNQILEKHQLSSSFWRVMRILETTEYKTFGEISDELYIEKPALTKIIKKLCVMEIVEIHQGKDKREKLVQLSSKGRDLIEQIRKDLNPFLAHVLQGVSQEEIDSTRKIFQIIRNNIMN